MEDRERGTRHEGLTGCHHGGDVVNHILAERTVREPEGVKSGLRWSADGSGQVGVDGDDAVAG